MVWRLLRRDSFSLRICRKTRIFVCASHFIGPESLPFEAKSKDSEPTFRQNTLPVFIKHNIRPIENLVKRILRIRHFLFEIYFTLKYLPLVLPKFSGKYISETTAGR